MQTIGQYQLGKHSFTSSKGSGFRRCATMDKGVADGKAKSEGTLKLRLKPTG